MLSRLLIIIPVLALSAKAAAPITVSASGTNANLGSSSTLSGSATDSDGNLRWIHFYVTGPGMSGWNHVGSSAASGSSDSGSVSWTAPSAGSWGVHIRAQDTNGTYDSNGNVMGSFTVRAPMSNPTSSNYTIAWGSSWSPSISAPSSNGSGTKMYAVAGYTNYQSGSWTPPGPGTYSFYVAQRADSSHYGNAVDPIQGPMQVNGSGYTLTVNKANQSAVSISPTSRTVNVGESISFSASGGSGTGAYTWSGSSGTSGASGTGSSKSVSFTSAGARTVSVYRAGDSNYNPSSTATATITVVSPPPTYYLTVRDGSGSGYYESAEPVSISADSPSYGDVFDHWTHVSGPGSISSSGSSSTTFTMGSGAATIQADYRQVEFDWGSTPSSVSSGQTYTVVVGVDSGGFPSVQLYKNGSYFSSGWFGTQGSTSDTGEQTVGYDATFSDSSNGSSGDDSRAVNIELIPMQNPTSSNYTINAGSSWAPTISAPSSNGTGTKMYAVVGYTNYRTGSWTPPSAGAYDFYVGQKADAHHEGNIVDPIQGPMRVNSSPYILTVNGQPPVITGQPQNQTVNAGANASFSITASGSGTLSYQWQRRPNGSPSFSNMSNGGSYSGVTSTTVVVSSVTAVMNGDQFRCVVTDSGGSTTSNAPTLTVRSAPAVTVNPQNQTVDAGANTSFSITASGSGTLSYQWQRRPNGSPSFSNLSNGGSYSGVTSTTVVVSSVTAVMNGDQFRCVVTDSGGSTTSNAATLTVRSAPAVTVNPQNQTVNAGASASFSITANGSGTLSYQWQRRLNGGPSFSNVSNGGSYSGVTSTNLAISSSTAAMSGDQFRCVVANSVGSTTSNAATLTVNFAPVITAQPQNQTVATGATATFSITATGSPAPTFQWRKNGSPLSNGGNISGATSSTLTITNVQSGDAATYSVHVSNSVGNVTSNGATLTLISGQPDPANQNELNIHLPLSQ